MWFFTTMDEPNMLTCELTAITANPSVPDAAPNDSGSAETEPLEQRLRQEGHRVIKQPGPIGTREWLLVFKPAPINARPMR